MTTNRKRKKTEAQLSLWAKLPQWAWQQGLRMNVDFAAHPDSASSPLESQRQPPEDCKDIKQAQVITSRIEYPQTTGDHRPVLDIDFPCAVVPSTTHGHFHLYLDKELEWTKYKALLNALAEAGIIETGYRDASIARGYTSVRVPWVKKPAPEELAAAEAAPAPAPAAPAPAAEAPDDQPEVETVDCVAGITAGAAIRTGSGMTLDANGIAFDNSDFLFGIDPGAPVTIAPRPSVHAPAWGSANGGWDSPGADPFGDIIAARDRIVNTPIHRSRANFELHYEAMTMSYRDNLGRRLSERAIRRGCEVLGINRIDLDGPRMEEVWTHLLNAHMGHQDEIARVRRQASNERRGIDRNLVIIDEPPLTEATMDASFAADAARARAREDERILQQERVDAANAAVEAVLPRPNLGSRMRDAILGNLTAAYAPTFATRAAQQREEDEAIRQAFTRRGNPLVPDVM